MQKLAASPKVDEISIERPNFKLICTSVNHLKLLEYKPQYWLVVSTPLKLKNIKVSWDDDISNIWKNKHVPNIFKPPTGIYLLHSIQRKEFRRFRHSGP